MIELHRLTRHFRVGEGIVRALDGIDLEVPDGDYLAIMGPSGSGKSTLLHLLGCLDRPTSGSYRLDGREVATLPETFHRDPADRIIVSTARIFRATLLTRDQRIVDSGVVPVLE